MSTAFRNVEFDSMRPITDWPAEAVETMLDRGGVDDWHLITVEIRRSPWGRVARIVEGIVEWGSHGAVDSLMASIITRARAEVSSAGRSRYATYIRELRAGSGLSLRDFAALAGTSAARLSSYERGQTAPTTDVLGRLEHAARVAG